MDLKRAMFAALLSFSPSVVLAQQLHVDAGRVRQCYNETPAGTQAPACIGAAANACQGLTDGGSTLGMSECIRLETEAWDKLLNQEYKALRSGFQTADPSLGEASPKELTESLRKAQRAWIAFRDADCGFAYMRWQGGTIRSVIYASCMLNMTAQRTLALRDMRNGDL